MLTRSALERINNRPEKMRVWPFAATGAASIALFAALYALGLSLPLALAAIPAGLAGLWAVYKGEKSRGIIRLVYGPLEGDTAARFGALREACEGLASSSKVWRVTRDQGAGPFSGGRVPAHAGRLDTPGFSADVPVWGIDAGDDRLLFLPDWILLHRSERYTHLSYESLKVACSTIRHQEEEAVPEDAEAVGRTWRYKKEDGRPDRRYANNPEIPILLYGLLKIESSSGLKMSLMASNRDAASRFARVFDKTRTEEEVRQESVQEERRREKRFQDAAADLYWAERRARAESARKVLGVAKDASANEISASYRKLARAYHPDKAAHLSPEVREAAEERMKEINAAYSELKLPRGNPAGEGRVSQPSR